MQHIIIKHISGSKADRVDEFSLEQFKTLTLGRGTGQTIQYDPDQDDLVSREHARISREEGQEDRFLITDLNSRNGTYINKQRISGTASVMPGDIIQLGPGGPQFQFDLDPRPDSMIRTTREADIPYLRQTREAATNPNAAISSPLPQSKTAVGRTTVERMLGQYQQSSRKTLINLAAALVGVIVIVAGVLLYMNREMIQDTRKEMANIYVDLGAKLEETQERVNISQKADASDPILSPADIVNAYGPATVYMEVSWKLIHTKSDRQVYHRYKTIEAAQGRRLPTYIRAGNRLYPWLFLDDESNTNVSIGGEHTGSGFVATNNGYILTNRHVAATWHTYYNLPFVPSLVYDVDLSTRRVNDKPILLIDSEEKARLLLAQLPETLPWVPANETLLVKKERDGFYVESHHKFEGRFDWLDVTFPKNKLRIPARLVRVSDRHDVALIKVDVPGSVPEVRMYDSYQDSRPGEVITVMGYPGISPDVHVRTKSQDPFNRQDKEVVVPDLTVTGGLIGKILRGEAIPEGGAAYDYSSQFGDGFQLTVNATGGGNSGGPVFDDHGRVIGIFFAGGGDSSLGHISFAVPIRFGMEIMEVKPVLK